MNTREVWSQVPNRGGATTWGCVKQGWATTDVGPEGHKATTDVGEHVRNRGGDTTDSPHKGIFYKEQPTNQDEEEQLTASKLNALDPRF